MFGMGTGELLVVFLIVLVLFGSHRLGDLGKNLGRAVSEFKKGMREVESIAPPSPAELASRPAQPHAAPDHDAHGGGSH